MTVINNSWIFPVHFSYAKLALHLQGALHEDNNWSFYDHPHMHDHTHPKPGGHAGSEFVLIHACVSANQTTAQSKRPWILTLKILEEDMDFYPRIHHHWPQHRVALLCKNGNLPLHFQTWNNQVKLVILTATRQLHCSFHILKGKHSYCTHFILCNERRFILGAIADGWREDFHFRNFTAGFLRIAVQNSKTFTNLSKSISPTAVANILK